MRGVAIIMILLMGMAPAWSQEKPKKKPPRAISVLHLGASANYYLGTDTDALNYDSDRISWQVDGIVGLAFKPTSKPTRNVLAVFGTYGHASPEASRLILQHQGYDFTLEDRQYFDYMQIEGGVIIAQVLRVSTGTGMQKFRTTEGDRNLYYLSTTIGLHISLGAVDWVTNCNILHGRDFSTSVFRPSTGIMVKF